MSSDELEMVISKVVTYIFMLSTYTTYISRQLMSHLLGVLRTFVKNRDERRCLYMLHSFPPLFCPPIIILQFKLYQKSSYSLLQRAKRSFSRSLSSNAL